MMFPWTLHNQNAAWCLLLCSLHGFIGKRFELNFDASSRVHGQSHENNKTDGFTVSHHSHGQSLKRSRTKHADILLSDESMRALVDISKNDDVTYSDYYDTLDLDPSYYDILDYIYVEDNATTPVTDTSTTSIEITSSSNSQTSTDIDTTSSEVISSYDIGGDNFTAPACDPETHFGCNVMAFERCSTKTKTCHCLKGYIREKNLVSRSPCVAAEFFRGHLKVRVTEDSDGGLLDHRIYFIESNLTYYLRLLLEDEGIKGLLNLTMFMPTLTPLNKHSVLSLTFDVTMRLGSLDLDGRHEIRDIWKRGLDSNSKLSQVALRGLLEILGWNNSRNDAEKLFSPLVETNPCHNSEHSYCHARSRCLLKGRRPSCMCRTGYEDVSPDVIQAPGEICLEDCGCENNGVCVTDPNHVEIKQCSCLNWFFGSKCQINGKELLVICCCSLGCLIVVAMLLWCCYYGCVKHKIRATKTNLFSLTPDTNFLKLPRIWMESSYHDNMNDISPHSIRRMSLASDCNPYIDGFILEDLPPSTLPSQRGEIYGSHYQLESKRSLGMLPEL